MSIKSIDRDTINRICSGQVVVSIQTAVKELVENSLDAGAKSIQIKLKDFGSEEIEVSDDGGGIAKENFKHLCVRHATSKIEKFDDLNNVMSFGFRGEALSSLCALSDYLEVRTRTLDSEIGYRLRYNRMGELVSEEPMARPQGTSIVVRELFKPQPVRRVQFKKNLKRHYASLLSVLQSYAIISKSVRFVCTNRVGKKSRTTALSTSGASKMLDNIASVFGVKFMNTLQSFEMKIYEKEDIEKDESLSGAKVCGFVSKMNHGVTLSNSGRQIIFVNGRPTDLPKVTRIVNQTWRHFEMSHKPAFVLDVRLPPGHADYNVTPDKRTILIVNEALLLTRLGVELSKLWEPSRFTYKVRSIESSLISSDVSISSSVAKNKNNDLAAAATEISESKEEEEEEEEEEDNTKSPVVATVVTETEMEVVEESIRNVDDAVTNIVESTKEEEEHVKKKRKISSVKNILLASTSTSSSQVEKNKNEEKEESTKIEENEEQNEKIISENNIDKRKYSSITELLLASKSSSTVAEAVASAATAGLTSAAIISPPRNKRPRNFNFRDSAGPRVNVTVKKHSRSELALEPPKPLKISLDILREYVVSRTSSSSSSSWSYDNNNDNDKTTTSFQGLGTKTNHTQDVEAQFERVFKKRYFRDMEILGQFNLGFIVARLKHDLFILDQHACDEKFNFERLHREAKMHSQRLIQPRTLHVSAQEEMIIIEHLDLFRKSGFDIEIDEKAAVGKRLKVRGMSHCMGASFNIEDLNEYASVLQDWTSIKGSKAPKLPKLDRLFASRACRSSVMIGMALDRRRMTNIVRNLETLDQPWNCPHGRPTMRHLYDLRCLNHASSDFGGEGGSGTTSNNMKRRRVFSHLDKDDA
jgi:DNA mismatch repair protein PMS2